MPHLGWHKINSTLMISKVNVLKKIQDRNARFIFFPFAVYRCKTTKANLHY